MGDMSKCTPCHRLFGFLFCFFKCLFASILRRLGRIHFPELRLGGPTHSGVRGALLRIRLKTGIPGEWSSENHLFVSFFCCSSGHLFCSHPCNCLHPNPVLLHLTASWPCAGLSHLPVPRQLLALLSSSWWGAEQDPCPAQPGTCTALQPARLFFTRLPSAK